MINNANDVFDRLFKDFSNKERLLNRTINKDKKNIEQIIPRTLRLSRIRLRLAIGIEYIFDTKYALVKRRLVWQTYEQILRCNEAWFSYESLKKHCQVAGYTKNVKTPADIFTKETIEGVFLN